MSTTDQPFDRGFIFQSFYGNVYKESNASLVWIDELYDTETLTIDGLWDPNWENPSDIAPAPSTTTRPATATPRVLPMIPSPSPATCLLSIYLDLDNDNENADNETTNEEDALFTQFEIEREQKTNEFLQGK